MEIFIISFLVIALILILKDVSITIKINEEIEKHALSLEQTQQIYDEEMQRRKLLLLDIEDFLSKAIFLKPFAILGGDKNQRIRLNEDFLCFKKCRYKRVNELEKLNKILREMQDSNLKGVLNIDYKLSV